MRSSIFSRERRSQLAELADWILVADAFVLPWSASAVSILTVAWLLVLIPTLDVADLRHELQRLSGGLPVLLFLLGAIGMSWAQVGWHDRLGGLDGFVKLLAIPLLAVQFSRSERGEFVLWAFFGSCLLLLLASIVVWFWPNLVREPHDPGVPVKAYIIQSIEFTVCAAALADLAISNAAGGRIRRAAILVLIALAFLADIVFVATGRTALVVIPALFVLYGVRRSGLKGALWALSIGVVLAAIFWVSSPYLRFRVTGVFSQTEKFLQTDAITSAGQRIAFWEKSVRFVEAAPIFGNGTGSITTLFTKAAAGQPGALGEISTNPHNMTFAVGIQLGLVGIAVLWAMWIAQLARFWTAGFIAWVGLILTTQNVVGSLFNSFIFDFTEGWLYVFGVGVAAGMLAREQAQSKDRVDA